MRGLLIVLLVALVYSGAQISHMISPSANTPNSSYTEAETIHFKDISGDYLFIKNLCETERMLHSLRNYLKDKDIQIKTSVPEDAVYYAESIWDPAWAAALPGGAIFCVESWDIFKNGVFQRTSYQVCKI